MTICLYTLLQVVSICVLVTENPEDAAIRNMTLDFEVPNNFLNPEKYRPSELSTEWLKYIPDVVAAALYEAMGPGVPLDPLMPFVYLKKNLLPEFVVAFFMHAQGKSRIGKSTRFYRALYLIETYRKFIFGGTLSIQLEEEEPHLDEDEQEPEQDREEEEGRKDQEEKEEGGGVESHQDRDEEDRHEEQEEEDEVPVVGPPIRVEVDLAGPSAQDLEKAELEDKSSKGEKKDKGKGKSSKKVERLSSSETSLLTARIELDMSPSNASTPPLVIDEEAVDEECGPVNPILGYVGFSSLDDDDDEKRGRGEQSSEED